MGDCLCPSGKTARALASDLVMSSSLAAVLFPHSHPNPTYTLSTHCTRSIHSQTMWRLCAIQKRDPVQVYTGPCRSFV